MTSKTEFFIDLQKIYKEKANQDLTLFKEIYKVILSTFELNFETPDETIKTFCENVGIQGLEVTHFRNLQSEFGEPNVDEISAEFFDEESLIGIYIAIRAFECYNTEYLTPPTEVDQIRPYAKAITEAFGGESVNEKYLTEM